MSGKLVSQVYERQLDHSMQSVLVAMADHADDWGNNCFPSVPFLAWKTGYGERQVQRIMAALRESGGIVMVKSATPRRPAEYRIDLAALPPKPPFRGDKMAPQVESGGDRMAPQTITRGDVQATPGVTVDAEGVTQLRHLRGDTATAPEPSRNHQQEPPDEPSAAAADAREGAHGAAAALDVPDGDDENAIRDVLCAGMRTALGDLPPGQRGRELRSELERAVRQAVAEAITPDELAAAADAWWHQKRKERGSAVRPPRPGQIIWHAKVLRDEPAPLFQAATSRIPEGYASAADDAPLPAWPPPAEPEPDDVDAHDLWQRIRSSLQLQMTRATFDAWLKQTRALELDGATLVVEVPNEATRDWLTNRLGPTVEEAVATAVGPGGGVRYKVAGEDVAAAQAERVAVPA